MSSLPARLAAVFVAAVLLCPAVARSTQAAGARSPLAAPATASSASPSTPAPRGPRKALPPRPLAPGEVRVVIDGHPAIARASSTLPSKDGRYSVAKLFDSRLDTAWVEGADGVGVGEWVEIEFDEPVELDGFLLAPGYGKSPRSFLENLAPASLSFTSSETPVEAEGYGLSDLVVSRFRLPMAPDCRPEATPAAWGPRIIVLREPIRARAFRATVGGALPNPAARHRDLAISEWRPVFAGKPPATPPGWQPISSFAVDLLRSLRKRTFDPRLLSPKLVVEDPFLTVTGDAPMMVAHRAWLASIGADRDKGPLPSFAALATNALDGGVALVPTSTGHVLVGDRTFLHGGKYARMALDYSLVVERSPKGPLALSAMRASANPMKCADKALPDLSRLPSPPYVPPPAPGATPDPRCPFHMAFLPGGSFKLGASGKTIEVEPFCIDRTELPASEYRFCADRPGGCLGDVPGELMAPYPYDPGTEGLPINGVTWEQARRYCETHLERLPTEAEWEWAARGGAAGNLYPWGNAPPTDQPCWKGPGNDAPGGDPSGPCPVQSHPFDVTPQGVYDMGGNLNEWTSTPEGKGERIIRGGAWNSSRPDAVESTARQPHDPNDAGVAIPERRFILNVRDGEDSPIADAPWVMDWNGASLVGTTDGSGGIDTVVPDGVRWVRLAVEGLTWELELGEPDPVGGAPDGERAGASSRPSNLGHDVGFRCVKSPDFLRHDPKQLDARETRRPEAP